MSSDSASVSVSTNTVSITCPMLESLKVEPDRVIITPLQPIRSRPKITPSSEQPHTWTIALECGVQPSSHVAEEFNNLAGGSAHEYAAASSSSSPSAMDFFFEVEMTMLRENAKVSILVYLGQDSSSGTPVWWMGGDFLINRPEPLLLVITENIDVKPLVLSGTNDSFTLTPVRA
jgi:hypothetical protein